MSKLNFTHLHVHTQYSLLDGASKITDLVRRAKEENMTSLAITDHGVMYGVIEFYKECINNGIKPILGVEAYVINGDINKKDSGRLEERYHLVLLAENNVGYQNLMQLVSISHVDGFYYKPRMNKEMLLKYHEGIIALSGCLSGEVAVNVLKGEYEKATQVAKEYRDIFGKDNFFLEMQANNLPEQIAVNEAMKLLSKELDIKLVATNDIHYIDYEDYEVQDILMCIQTGKKVNDVDRMKMPVNSYYFKTEKEMLESFEDCKEALINTGNIADRCNVNIEFGKYKLPKFQIDTNESPEAYLTSLCMDGLIKKYKEEIEDREKYAKLIDRLQYEIKIIKEMGFVDYFLIVWDFIKFAKDNNIPVGPGRGSAAGSLVSYVLNITEIDPIKYNLLFERFLNPERVSMPDIDVDFCNIRRQEVIDYVTNKYGHDCVTQIVTFGTMAAKMVLRDVGRVIDMPYQEVDSIVKLVPHEMKITIEKALEISKELKELYLENANVRYLINTAKKLEGLPRHSSTHAAGVVITEKPTSFYVPLAKSENFVVTQFNMTTIEELGLLKMDFLGLRNLTVIKDAVNDIEKNYGVKLNINKIDINDENVYKMISKGLTEGIFQLESKGITTFMKELEPSSLEDIIAGISLYRPGPMDFIPEYLKNKRNPSNVKYDANVLKEILEPTYGVIVYQEQVMEIFRKLAGYTFGRSDLVRRAMSKKKMDVMLKEKDIFLYGSTEDEIEGAIKRGVSKEVAERIYEKMIDFAKYAFNKSHSACYAFLAYQTGYLKYYYPAEFFAALITSVESNQGMVSNYVVAAKNQGIQVLPPDINESSYTFSAFNGNIRYALSAVKGIGKEVIENLVKERNENGKFTSLTDFIERMLKYNIQKRAIENLIKVGAFDWFGGNRSQYLAIYIMIYDKLLAKRRRMLDGQLDLFSLGMQEDEKIFDDLPNIEEISERLKLLMEKELLGVYVSGHPLLEYADIIKSNAEYEIATLNQKDDETEEYLMSDNKEIKIAGIINKVTLKLTKTNNMMAFVRLEDMTGELELVVFPGVYERFKKLLEEDEIIWVKGKTNIKEDEGCKVLVSEIKKLESMKKDIPLTLEIESIKDKNLLENLEKILRMYEGNDRLQIKSKDDEKIRYPKIKIKICDGLINNLKLLLGDENVNILK